MRPKGSKAKKMNKRKKEKIWPQIISYLESWSLQAPSLPQIYPYDPPILPSVMYNHEYWETMQVDGFQVIHPNSIAFPHQDGIASFHHTCGLGTRHV
jgi:hypothetical protein